MALLYKCAKGLFCLASIVLAGCVTVPSDPDAFRKVWSSGTMMVPPVATKKGKKIWGPTNRVLPKLEAGLKPGVKVPLVIWAHGCTGFSFEGTAFMKVVAEIGFAVIAPESYGRPRPLDCDPKTHTTYNQPYALRIAEVLDALRRAQDLPWVDKKNVFLAGFSQGGNTVARYSGTDFKGLIISGVTCGGWDGHQGINAPDNVPVLVIYGDEDEWNSQYPFRCDPELHDGPSRLIRLPGVGHSVILEDGVSDAIKSFLTALRTK